MSVPLLAIPEDRLPVLAAQINRAHDLACRSAQAAISHAIAVGEALIEAKSLLGRGEWLPWLAENCDFSARAAQSYMQLARHRDEIEANTQAPAYLTVENALKQIAKERPKVDKLEAIATTAAPAVAAQAEWDRQREEHKAALPAFVAEGERVKAAAIEARKEKPADLEALLAEIEELREANAALEEENGKLKAENKKFEEMRVQFEMGGFEEVIRGKDEQIRVLNRRVERESGEKVRNLNYMERWKKRAIDHGWTNHVIIPLDDLPPGAT